MVDKQRFFIITIKYSNLTTLRSVLGERYPWLQSGGVPNYERLSLIDGLAICACRV